MNSDGSRKSALLMAVMIAACCLSLAACGRKGPLEPPPSAAIPPAPKTSSAPVAAPAFVDPTTPTGAPQQAPLQTSEAQPTVPSAPPPPPAQPAQNKSFFLDFLLK
jgi:predicted small lipoprotein YifL